MFSAGHDTVNLSKAYSGDTIRGRNHLILNIGDIDPNTISFSRTADSVTVTRNDTGDSTTFNSRAGGVLIVDANYDAKTQHKQQWRLDLPDGHIDATV